MVRRDMAVYDEHPGLSETRQFFPRLLQAFPDLAVRIETIIAEGDNVAIHAWYEWRAHGYTPSAANACASRSSRSTASRTAA